MGLWAMPLLTPLSYKHLWKTHTHQMSGEWQVYECFRILTHTDADTHAQTKLLHTHTHTHIRKGPMQPDLISKSNNFWVTNKKYHTVIVFN